MIKLKQGAIAGLAAVAAIGLAACGERTGSPTAQGEPAKEQAPLASPPPAAADMMVTAAVKAALASDAQTQAVKADVQAAGGKVVLKGSAPDPAARDRAGQVVASVRGVTSVDNQLSVGGS